MKSTPIALETVYHSKTINFRTNLPGIFQAQNLRRGYENPEKFSMWILPWNRAHFPDGASNSQSVMLLPRVLRGNHVGYH